jgi:hypothetical protein
MVTTQHLHEIFKHVRLRKGIRAPEWVMMNVAQHNCSYYGPFYYGPQGAPPFIGHLDGRNTHNETTIQMTFA